MVESGGSWELGVIDVECLQISAAQSLVLCTCVLCTCGLAACLCSIRSCVATQGSHLCGARLQPTYLLVVSRLINMASVPQSPANWHGLTVHDTMVSSPCPEMCFTG